MSDGKLSSAAPTGSVHLQSRSGGAACLQQPLRVAAPSPAGWDSRPSLIRLIHRSFCLNEPVQHQSLFSGWEEKKKIICDFGPAFPWLLRIPATKAPSLVSSSSQQKRKVPFLMQLFAFFIRLSRSCRPPPPLHARARSALSDGGIQ